AEHSPVAEIMPGQVVTRRGEVVRGHNIVRATEGFTASLAGHRRTLVPIYSLMIATEPLPATVWATIGLQRRETFSDGRNLIIYGQRTADDRLAFGGRGAPYHFGSAVKPAYDTEARVFSLLEETLRTLLPQLGTARVTHRWGGPLGVPRDWMASVGLDTGSRIGWAGGYVGDGVSTTNLAGRTLADLILNRPSDLVQLPWVDHRSPLWEPEPLRWLGVNGARSLIALADEVEQRRGVLAPRPLSWALNKLTGG
ncbi:MAG: FAD-dependent oxidoreductase, partial [Actinobacteria bacterium]|nr:FAD-dependent oxidoreductase [Actinomycetota bacterium]